MTDQAIPTREQMDALSRAECIDLLEAHGLELNPDSDLDLSQLRSMAKRTVFLEGETL